MFPQQSDQKRRGLIYHYEIIIEPKLDDQALPEEDNIPIPDTALESDEDDPNVDAGQWSYAHDGDDDRDDHQSEFD